MKTKILQAIMDNKTVQYKLWPSNTKWQDLDMSTADLYTSELFASLFNNITSYIWRIKPDMKEIYRKPALMDNGFAMYVFMVSTIEESIELEENSSYFVKWLGDWTTYTVEV